MKQKTVYLGLVLFLGIGMSARLAAQGMTMPGMENSVGFLSSGTSVQPKTTAEFEPMIHKPLGKWTFMFHGNAFIVDTQQTGPRGKDKFYAPNWAMPALLRQYGRNTFMLRTMVSLDPLTVTDRRYPLLFQSGETAFGRPIVDGQHPHEFFMEIAGRYDFKLTNKSQLYVYGGPVGEPALGPTSFPHRASASENPSAVLSHHQQDSTHISNNVITVGFSGGPMQLEASTFRGREPDENRWNIDTGKPDSFSSRLTLSAGNDVTGQFSVGRINNREALEPELDTLRMTASIQHSMKFSSGHLATSLIWGRNKDIESHGRRIFNSYTLESTVNFRLRNWLWTRIENVDRDATLLAGETTVPVEEEPIGRVQAYTFGYERDLPWQVQGVKMGLGGQVTTYGVPPLLKTVYGSHPAGFSIFLRIRPKGNVAEHMQMMHQH